MANDTTPHSSWIPPEWQANTQAPRLDTQGNAKDIGDDGVTLNCPTSLGGRFDEVKGALNESIKKRGIKFERTQDKLPDPKWDFTHVDPGAIAENELDQPEKEAIRNASKTIEKLNSVRKELQNENRPEPDPRLDPELGRLLEQADAPLRKLSDLLSGNPLPMQRLALVFEWILCQVTTFFGEINLALVNDKQDKYEEARKAYIAFLEDLDDHEPRRSKQRTGESGYGRAIKWASINPVIDDGQITGAVVRVKWNPHISSSGIPIQHA